VFLSVPLVGDPINTDSPTESPSTHWCFTSCSCRSGPAAWSQPSSR
jgi:hypothetical protein